MLTRWLRDAESDRSKLDRVQQGPLVNGGSRRTESYFQVWARQCLAGVRADEPRVLRLMREATFLAPTLTG